MVSRVVGEGEGVIVREAIALAVKIAGKSQVSVQAQKEADRQRWYVLLVCFLFILL
jgi:hypothetical protein